MKISLLLSNIDLAEIMKVKHTESDPIFMPRFQVGTLFEWNRADIVNPILPATGAILRAYVPDEVTINRAYTILNRNYDTTTEGIFHYG